jgi:hypothetical protein
MKKNQKALCLNEHGVFHVPILTRIISVNWLQNRMASVLVAASTMTRHMGCVPE